MGMKGRQVLEGKVLIERARQPAGNAMVVPLAMLGSFQWKIGRKITPS